MMEDDCVPGRGSEQRSRATQPLSSEARTQSHPMDDTTLAPKASSGRLPPAVCRAGPVGHNKNNYRHEHKNDYYLMTEAPTGP